MKFTRLIIALLVTQILLQENTTTDSKHEPNPQLQKAFELLLQASQGLDVTDPEKIKHNRPIEAGLAVTWFDEQLGEACVFSLDKIDEQTSIVLFSHAKPESLKDINFDSKATEKIALIRHVTNAVDLTNALARRREVKNGLQVPAKP